MIHVSIEYMGATNGTFRYSINQFTMKGEGTWSSAKLLKLLLPNKVNNYVDAQSQPDVFCWNLPKSFFFLYEKGIYEQTARCLITFNGLFHGQVARFVYAAHLEPELSARLEAKVAIWFVSFCAGSICAHCCACPVCPASVQPIRPRPSLRKNFRSHRLSLCLPFVVWGKPWQPY